MHQAGSIVPRRTVNGDMDRAAILARADSQIARDTADTRIIARARVELANERAAKNADATGAAVFGT